MQLATMLLRILESGKITLSTKNKDDIEITAKNKLIDINAKNKTFIRDLFSNLRKTQEDRYTISEIISNGPEMIKTAGDIRKMLDNVAEEFKESGITITLSYEGDVVLTMGSGARAKLSRIVTGTKAIEINSLSKLIELGLQFK